MANQTTNISNPKLTNQTSIARDAIKHKKKTDIFADISIEILIIWEYIERLKKIYKISSEFPDT